MSNIREIMILTCIYKGVFKNVKGKEAFEEVRMGSYSRRGYKALSFALIVLTFSFFTFSCSDSVDNDSDELIDVLQNHGMGIERKTEFLEYKGELLSEIPSYNLDIYNPIQIDLRGDDLSGVDLRSKIVELVNSTFDTNTIWPEKLLPTL